MRNLGVLPFAQNYSSGFTQRRLDYIFILNTLQEFVTISEILTPISTDHSPVLFSLSREKETVLELEELGNIIAPYLKPKTI